MTEKNQVELFDPENGFDLFDLTSTEKPQKEKQKKNSKKKKNNSCGASTKTGGSCTTSSSKPKEPEKDLERFVVLTNDNEQMTFPAEMSLEEIRAELEKEYPAYTKQNTNWHFEKQEDKSRYLCIPSYKSNKMG